MEKCDNNIANNHHEKTSVNTTMITKYLLVNFIIFYYGNYYLKTCNVQLN